MRNIMLVLLNVLLAQSITQALYAQPPTLAVGRCYAEQEWLVTRIHRVTPTTAAIVTFSDEQRIVFASDSGGKALGGPVILAVTPSGQEYRFAGKRAAAQEVSHLFTTGTQKVTLRAPDKQSIFWLLISSPCPGVEVKNDVAEVPSPKPGLMLDPGPRTVVTAAQQPVARRPTAMPLPTPVATALAQAPPMPAATSVAQPVAESEAALEQAQPSAMVVALTALALVLLTLRLIRNGLLLTLLLVAAVGSVLGGWHYRAQIVAYATQLRDHREVRRVISLSQQTYAYLWALYMEAKKKLNNQ